MILLHLDGAGPFGDPYQVNSANNGPYGDAVTQELIPYVEKKYRGIGEPYARVLDGASTGGWVSLALQVFYPDFFNGAWSHAPDPVDFRAYELINIYKDDNAYVNGHGFERPVGARRSTAIVGPRCGTSASSSACWAAATAGSCRARTGARGTRSSARAATTACRGRCGTARPARSTARCWSTGRSTTCGCVLEKNWATLGPKLRGKLHIWVGEADDYFLNNAVHLLDDFLRGGQAAVRGEDRLRHGQRPLLRGITEEEMMAQMAIAMSPGTGAKGQAVKAAQR